LYEYWDEFAYVELCSSGATYWYAYVEFVWLATEDIDSSAMFQIIIVVL